MPACVFRDFILHYGTHFIKETKTSYIAGSHMAASLDFDSVGLENQLAESGNQDVNFWTDSVRRVEILRCPRIALSWEHVRYTVRAQWNEFSAFALHGERVIFITVPLMSASSSQRVNVQYYSCAHSCHRHSLASDMYSCRPPKAANHQFVPRALILTPFGQREKIGVEFPAQNNNRIIPAR